MKRIFRDSENPVANWIPHEYLLETADEYDALPTRGVPAGSLAYVAGGSQAWQLSPGGEWVEVQYPTINVIGDAAISIRGHKLIIESAGGGT